MRDDSLWQLRYAPLLRGPVTAHASLPNLKSVPGRPSLGTMMQPRIASTESSWVPGSWVLGSGWSSVLGPGSWVLHRGCLVLGRDSLVFVLGLCPCAWSLGLVLGPCPRGLSLGLVGPCPWALSSGLVLGACPWALFSGLVLGPCPRALSSGLVLGPCPRALSLGLLVLGPCRVKQN